jgi:hypothetical protein
LASSPGYHLWSDQHRAFRAGHCEGSHSSLSQECPRRLCHECVGRSWRRLRVTMQCCEVVRGHVPRMRDELDSNVGQDVDCDSRPPSFSPICHQSTVLIPTDHAAGLLWQNEGMRAQDSKSLAKIFLPRRRVSTAFAPMVSRLRRLIFMPLPIVYGQTNSGACGH